MDVGGFLLFKKYKNKKVRAYDLPSQILLYHIYFNSSIDFKKIKFKIIL